MEEIQNTPSPTELPRESFLPVSNGAATTNYHHFGGRFGGIRRGFHNPSILDRNHYPYPPVSRARGRPGLIRTRTRSASPVMNSQYAAGSQQWENIQQLNSDCPMTTPDMSRNPSVATQHGPQATHPGLREPCQFGVTTRSPANGLDIPRYVSYIPTNPPQPDMRSRSVSVANMLNPSSPFPVSNIYGHPSTWTTAADLPLNTNQQDPNSLNATSPFQPVPNIYSSHNWTPVPNIPAPPNNQQTPLSQTPPGSLALTPYSEISTSTIRPILSVQEQRYLHFITLYNACLSASIAHLSTLRRHSRISSRRYHPYVPPPPYHSHTPPSATLMDNISAICTHLWRKARNDGMAPHKAEADAVRTMRDLYAWGEVMVRGLEGEGGEDVEMRGERSEVWHDELARVGVAARGLCRWFRDRRAWGVCEEVLGELTGLEERGFRRESEGDGIV